jgi:hypothetical protein
MDFQELKMMALVLPLDERAELADDELKSCVAAKSKVFPAMLHCKS